MQLSLGPALLRSLPPRPSTVSAIWSTFISPITFWISPRFILIWMTLTCSIQDIYDPSGTRILWPALSKDVIRCLIILLDSRVPCVAEIELHETPRWGRTGPRESHTCHRVPSIYQPKLILSSILTRYNGTPRGVTNCNEGGCDHCNGTTYPGSVAYDCVCLHAEENALLEAGRERVGQGSVLYCNTLRSSTRPLPMLIRIYRCPCLKCTIKIIQTGVKMVVYNLSYKVYVSAARLPL